MSPRFSPRPSQVRAADDVDRLLAELYGAAPEAAGGVLHVAAVWQSGAGEYRVIQINSAAPRSELDFFVLNAARARADAIVTSGKILRQEPEVVHDLQGEAGAALHRWRQRRGQLQAPVLVVLTSGRGLDAAHPALHSWPRPLLYTGSDDLERRLRGELEVRVDPQASLRRAVAHLIGERGCRTVLVETGPSTARSLYELPLRVDELLLSVFRGAVLAPAARGAPFLAQAALAQLLPIASPGFHVEEESGPWSFHSFRAARCR